MRRFATACGLAGALVAGAGCEALLGPPPVTPAPISLANVSLLAGSWQGTWRNSRGAAGALAVSIASAATRERVSGTVHFSDSRCPRVAPLEGRMVDDRLVVTADLGSPCGIATLTFIESRSGERRLTGSFKTDYPEDGLFVVYPH